MKAAAALISALAMANCQGDETVAAYGAGGRNWRLVEIDGAPFTARAILSFPQPGEIAGQAPCNSYSGPLTAPYPWFGTGPIAVTRKACAELADETRFFTALKGMTLSEVGGATMILSDETGREMVFRADE